MNAKLRNTSPSPLRRAREERGWSQSQLAEALGTNHFTISRWERGRAFPSPYCRQRLCEV
jgi:ribosome-binding protein aMBF1 (putative translation factor)